MAKALKTPRYQPRKTTGLCLMRDLLDFDNYLAGILKLEVTTDGLDIQETNKGLHLTSGHGGNSSHPFKLNVASVEGGNSLTVSPGTFSGMMPSMGGVPLDAASPPSTSVSGLVRVWLKVTYVYEMSEETIVHSELESVKVETGSTVPEDNEEDGIFHIQIGTVNNGAVLAQTVTHSLWGQVCDDGGVRVGEAG